MTSHTFEACTNRGRCAEHRREYFRRWHADHPGYSAARGARLRAERRRCAVAGCDLPIYVSSAGHAGPRCRGHEAERRRLLYTPRSPRRPWYADHADARWTAIAESEEPSCARWLGACER